MKFTEFIKDYVKKHPGVKYKDAIKDKKVRCLWHDHRGKEIGCPSTCPPVPQERAQFTTLPRPASIDTPEPIRQYTPQTRQPPILGRTRNDPPQQQQGHVTADGFPISQVANAINRSYRTAPQGQSFLSGLINTVGENLANALHGIHEAIPGDRPILADSDSWIGTISLPRPEEPEPSVVSTPALTLATGYSEEDEEFYETNPSMNRVAQIRKIYSGQLTQEEKDKIRAELEGDTSDMPPGEQVVQGDDNFTVKYFDKGKELMDAFKFSIEPKMTGTPAKIAEETSSFFNNTIEKIIEKDKRKQEQYRNAFVSGLNSGGDNGRLYKVTYNSRKDQYIYSGAGLRKKKSRKYI